MVRCAWFSCVKVENGKVKKVLKYCEDRGCPGEFKSRLEGKMFCINFLMVEEINRGDENGKRRDG